MKRIYLLALLLFVLAGHKVLATVVTQRPVNNEVHQKFVQNMKTCQPYTESMSTDYMGMNIYYKIQIKGWVNNKCRLDFDADIKGRNKDLWIRLLLKMLKLKLLV